MDVEEQLRAALAGAAAEVQQVQPLPRRRRRRTVVLLAAAAALVVAAGVGVVQLLSGATTDGGGAADCAYVVRWQGRDYSGIGEQQRTLEPGRALGDGVLPGCDDGGGEAVAESIALYALGGIDPTVAVTDRQGQVLLADDRGEVPAQLRELDRPVPCRLTAPTTVRATAWAIRGDRPAPYALTLQVFAGDGPPAEGYAAVLLPASVPAGTPGADDRTLIDTALQESAPLQVELTCAGDRYVVTSLSSAG